MASHHYSRNSHHQTCCCRCCCCSSSNPSPLPPSPPLTDSLLQAIASHLLQSPTPNFQSQYEHKHHHPQQNQTQTQTLLLLQSLLSRVFALESSLHRLSSPPSQPPPSPTPPPPPPPPPPTSLRHLAARTIQTHFRAFLVRRSQTLRYLKDLATIKSNLASLKSFLLDKTHLTPAALYKKASDLLIKLDSVQSRDSLIREGRRAIRSELVQFLKTVEGLPAKCQSNLPPKSKKVSFAENVILPSAEAARNIRLGSESEGGRKVFSVAESEEDESHPEMEGFHDNMNDERNPRRNFIGGASHEGNGIFQSLNGNFQGQDPNFLGYANFGYDHPCELPTMGDKFGYGMNGWGYNPWPMNGELTHGIGNLGLSAPMPVQMEKRASDLLKERPFDNPRKW